MRSRLQFVLLFAVVLSAPVAVRGAEPASRGRGDLAIAARDILQRHCSGCHDGKPEPGKRKLKVMDYPQLLAKGPPVPFVTPRGRSQILELVKDGSMPPANKLGPNAAEIATLEQWVQAGAPAFPSAFDERFTLEAIADDLDRGRAAQSTRYVSFAHLVRDGQPPPDLSAAERLLNDALSAATGTQVKLEAVDPTATLYRIDLAKLGWQTRDLFEKRDRLKPAGAHTYAIRPFDLLLLEYPHAAVPVTKRLDTFLDTKNQARPVPFVRGDWLTAALVRDGKLTLLAEELKSLAALERAIADGIEKPEGPLGPRALGTANPLALPKPADGRAPIPPLSGWYVGDVAPDPAPFALTVELVSDGQPVKSVKEDQPYKLRVRSDQRVDLTLVLVQPAGDVRVDAIAGGSVLLKDAPREIAFTPGGIVSGVPAGSDAATAYLVLFASPEGELPKPVVVRSLHSDRQVWRFLTEPTAKDVFDPNKVVRKVIPVHVTKK
jgi:hypothetical protein